MQKTGIPLVFHCRLSWQEAKLLDGAKPPGFIRRCLFGWPESGTIKCPSHPEMLITTLYFFFVQLPLFLLKKPHAN